MRSTARAVAISAGASGSPRLDKETIESYMATLNKKDDSEESDSEEKGKMSNRTAKRLTKALEKCREVPGKCGVPEFGERLTVHAVGTVVQRAGDDNGPHRRELGAA